MDVSHVNANKDAQFAWGTNYKNAETDDFAVFLEKDDTRSEPVREAKSNDTDDRYEKDDVSDDDIKDVDDRDDDNIADAADTRQPQAASEQAAPFAGTTDVKQETAQATPTNSASTSPVVDTQKTASAGPVTNTPVNPQDTTGQATAAAANANGTSTKADAAPTQEAANTVGNLQASSSKESASSKPTTGIETEKTVATAGNPQQSTDQAAKSQNSATTNTTATTAKSATPAETVQVTTNSAAMVEVQANNIGKESKPGQMGALEVLRQEETASLSEKEILSNKIGEMLHASKGKVSLASASQTPTVTTSPSLVSGQTAVETSANIVSAKLNMSTAVGTVTEATQQAETPISFQPAPTNTAPVTAQASADPAATGNSSIQGAAIPGVEASSANSASQANTAARAATQAGSPAEQVSNQITAAVKEGADKIKIQLHPADLGRVDIQLEMGKDGRITAVIAADNQDSLDLLKQDSKLLEKALQDAGFETGSDSLNFSLNQQNDPKENLQTAMSNSESTLDEGGVEDVITPLPMQAYGQSSTSNLDIQV